MIEFLVNLIMVAICIAVLVFIVDLTFLLLGDFMPSRQTIISILALIAGFFGFRYWKKNQDKIKEGNEIQNNANDSEN